MLRFAAPVAQVLVIDDSPTMLKLAELVLTKAGYRVVTAASGEAGLESAREATPDIVLVDYLMPDRNGFDVCAALAADPATAFVPIVVMSAKEDEMAERATLAHNVADTITKPFAPEALLAVISHTLRRSTDDAAATDDGGPLALGHEPAAGEVGTGEIIVHAALSGDLAQIAIADILLMLQDQGQTGVLTISHEDTRLETFFRDGRVDFATAVGVADEFLLGRFLVEAGELAPEALHVVIAERMQAGSAGLLGEDLIARGLITRAGLEQAMRTQTAALVYESLRWVHGRFWFRVTLELPPIAAEAALAIPVDGLLMEGLRRVDEWRVIERAVGSFELVLIRNEDQVASFGRGKLTADELTMLDYVNGKNTVTDIVSLSQMGSFDVSKLLYRLLRTKLVRKRVSPRAV